MVDAEMPAPRLKVISQVVGHGHTIQAPTDIDIEGHHRLSRLFMYFAITASAFLRYYHHEYGYYVDAGWLPDIVSAGNTADGGQRCLVPQFRYVHVSSPPYRSYHTLNTIAELLIDSHEAGAGRHQYYHGRRDAKPTNRSAGISSRELISDFITMRDGWVFRAPPRCHAKLESAFQG